MNPTIRELVMQYLETALDGLPAAGGNVPVYRTRLDAIPQDELPAFCLAIDKEDPSGVLEETLEAVGRDLTISVYCVTSSGQSESPTDAIDKVADPLTAWAEQKVMQDLTLGGLVEVVRWSGAGWQNVPEDLDLTGVRITFVISYYTGRGDPTTR